ncbi:hypothetical protein S83_070986, partial [Arachis hypogaea]
LLLAGAVGKGLSLDAQAQKLAFQHWIEAIDPRHRYGHNLHYYYEEWCKTDSRLFPGSSLDIGSLHLDSKQLSQITLNLPANAFASKIILWII